MVETHIASLVVHARPAAVAGVIRQIGRLHGAEVHGSSPAGKVVVTLEQTDSFILLQQIDAIRALDGVLMAALVYHEVDAGPEPVGELEPCS